MQNSSLQRDALTFVSPMDMRALPSTSDTLPISHKTRLSSAGLRPSPRRPSMLSRSIGRTATCPYTSEMYINSTLVWVFDDLCALLPSACSLLTRTLWLHSLQESMRFYDVPAPMCDHRVAKVTSLCCQINLKITRLMHLIMPARCIDTAALQSGTGVATRVNLRNELISAWTLALGYQETFAHEPRAEGTGGSHRNVPDCLQGQVVGCY